jgi:hypothetical protein
MRRPAPDIMRALLPMGLLAAALIALLATPAEAPLFGLSHDEFRRGAFGGALLLWLLMSGPRARRAHRRPAHLQRRGDVGADRRDACRGYTFPAPNQEALALQRPLPDDALRIVARGKKEDGPDGD